MFITNRLCCEFDSEWKYFGEPYGDITFINITFTDMPNGTVVTLGFIGFFIYLKWLKY